MADNAKLFVGRVKSRSTKFGTAQKIGLSKKDVELLLAKLNDKGYVNLDLFPRKAEGKHGETHTLVIDEWQPDPAKAKKDAKKPSKEDHPDDEEIPF